MYVSSFLGGITFAAMILLMQSSDKFSTVPLSSLSPLYPNGLIIGTAVTSVLFIGSSIGMIKPASGLRKTEKEHPRLAGTMADLGFLGLMVLLPFLALPFSIAGAVILVILDASMIFLLYFY